ncbi:MAG: LuxR C-terminal-related transcriptional regulator [Treponema sp.]|nr:LuxR C-terminal-related transcriptional regulator [Treponema sp.]
MAAERIPGRHDLSMRGEFTVMMIMVKNGKNNKQIAVSLGIKARTVENILHCV